MSTLACRVDRLFVHPVKSCGGIAVAQALVIETGLEFDRAFMVVDDHGEMLTQREWPRMALVMPQFKAGDLVLRAPGMLALHLRLDAVEAATRVRVWNDVVKAYDMGDLAAQWFTDFLASPGAGPGRVRLVRFDPEQQRLSNPRWTGAVQAENAFSDGFPVLVANRASMADLNARLAAAGAAPVGIERFRPNIVLDGLEPFDEDHVDELRIAAADGGEVVLRLVKPCVRCTIPNVDPATGTASPEVGDVLATFRADPRMDGGLTFAMNAIVIDGVEREIAVGAAAAARLAF